MQTLWQDLRYGMRQLLKHPGFSLIAVLTLALGIGANTSIFSVLYAVLLKPLPYSEPERLVAVNLTTKMGQFQITAWPYPLFEAARDHSQSFAAMAAYTDRKFNLVGAQETERVQTELVSASYFSLLGINATTGRTFLPEEDRTPGTHPVAVISYGLWQRRFGGGTEVLGQTMNLDKTAFTIVGVLPNGFRGQDGNADVWVPMMMTSALLNPDMLTAADTMWHSVLARLKPGVTQAQAQAELRSLNQSLPQFAPPKDEPDHAITISTKSLKDTKVDPAISRSFQMLLAAVGFVLLIACANVANLLLARAVARRKEFAVRLALGASRRRIVQQLLIESLLLAVIGGIAGLVIASWGVDLLRTVKPLNSIAAFSEYVQAFDYFEIKLDRQVLLFNFALALLTGLLFGLFPAWQSSRADVNEALKDGTGASTQSWRKLNPRRLLVIAEIALSLVLLISAGLLLRSFAKLQAVPLGFDPQGVLTMSLGVKNPKPDFHAQLLEQVQALPGVQTASLANNPPVSGIALMSRLQIAGRENDPALKLSMVAVHLVTPEYIPTLKINTLQGRGLTAQDRQGTAPVVLISRAAAEKFWPGVNPIGQRIRAYSGGGDESKEPFSEVVGVVEDVKTGAMETPDGPAVYYSSWQVRGSRSYLLLKAAGDPTALVAAVRQVVNALDKTVAIYDVKTMPQRTDEATSRSRYAATLLALFATLALVLAAIGIYGVMAYSVSARVRELGIRLALGAQTRDVLWLILMDGVKLILPGVLLGSALAYFVTRVLNSQLYGVTATDPLTFIAVASFLSLIALVACYLPARRATKVDPMIALRDA